MPIAIYKSNSVTASPAESPGLLTELPPKLLSNSSALLTSTLLTALLNGVGYLGGKCLESCGSFWGIGCALFLCLFYFSKNTNSVCLD